MKSVSIKPSTVFASWTQGKQLRTVICPETQIVSIIKENMEAYTSNWDELIKRRAISDLFKIVSKCNDEIAKIVEVYRLKIEKATSELVLYQYTSEQFMQIESALFLCKQYFTSDEFMRTKERGTLNNPYAFEEFIGGTVSLEFDDDEDLAGDTKIAFSEGTKLALNLIDKYEEALKNKVLDSASDNLLCLVKENSDD